MNVKDQSIFIIGLAMYGTWRLVGTLAGYLIRPKRKTRVYPFTQGTGISLPPPDRAVRRAFETAYANELYKRRLERQG